MERFMRIALLSLMGAAAFKVAYATLYLDDAAARERDVTVRAEVEAGEFAQPRDESRRR